MRTLLQHQLHASQQPARLLPAAVGAHLYPASAALMGAADAPQVDKSPTAGLQALQAAQLALLAQAHGAGHYPDRLQGAFRVWRSTVVPCRKCQRLVRAQQWRLHLGQILSFC